MTPRTIIDQEPSIATDIVVIGQSLAGAYAHRRITKDIVVGQRHIAAHRSGNIDFPARDEPIKQFLESIAACVDTKGVAMSWGWAEAHGARLCPDCWEHGFGNAFDGGTPAFELEAQPVAEDGTLIEVAPSTVDESPSEEFEAVLAEAERGYQDIQPPEWDEEWGAQEPLIDEDWGFGLPPDETPTATCGYRAANGAQCQMPAGHNMGQADIPENHRVSSEPPTRAGWDHYHGITHGTRPVVRGPDVP